MSKTPTKLLIRHAIARGKREGRAWMATPEGREFLRRKMKQRIRNGYIPPRGKAGRKPTPKEASSNGTHPSPPTPKTHSGIAEQLPYIYGRLEVQLEVYAADLGCTFSELALGLSELLRDQARRKMVGASHRVPSVRRGSA